MYLYIVLLFFVGWISHALLTKYYSKKVADIIFFISVFTPCLFAMAFRTVSVGVDTPSYKGFFEDYALYSWEKVLSDQGSGHDSIAEPGLRILMKLCAEVYPDYYYYQFIFSLIYILLYVIFIGKYTNNVVLASAIFIGGGLYVQSFNGARQMLAIAFFAYSLPALFKREFIKSFCWIGFAYLFHSSCILGFMIFPIYALRNRKYILALAPVLIFIAVLSIEQFLLPMIFVLFGDKYIEYAVSEFNRPNTGLILRLIWIINFTIALVTLFYKIDKENTIKVLSILTLAGAACYWIGYSINYADRVSFLFLPAILLLYDNCANCIKSTFWRNVFCNGFTIFYIAYFWHFTNINVNIAYVSIIN